jgi:hypothetical protein
VQRCGTPENMQNGEENFHNMQTTDNCTIMEQSNINWQHYKLISSVKKALHGTL